jgi:hypothetical protein
MRRGATSVTPSAAARSAAAAAVLVVALTAGVGPATAQWTRVTQIPAADMWSVFAAGDTVAAGSDTVAYVSTDGGGSWTVSDRVGPAVLSVEALRFHAGRLYAGSYGQGVYASGDLGQTFVPASDGLSGGLFNSHLYITDFAVRDGRLFAATDGAGVFALGLATPGVWAPYFRSDLQGSSYESIVGLETGAGRMLAAGGANGVVARNDASGTGWQFGFLDDQGLWPGLLVSGAAWSGSAWVVATDGGVFRSADGATGWSHVVADPGGLTEAKVVARDGEVWAALNRGFSSLVYYSPDHGATWSTPEALPAPVYELALAGDRLWAARGDGLWTRSAVVVAVGDAPRRAAPTRLALAGRHPVGREARLRFTLSEASDVTLDLYDATGRRLLRAIDGPRSAGAHEAALDLGALGPGVYFARLTAGGRADALRLVRLDGGAAR